MKYSYSTVEYYEVFYFERWLNYTSEKGWEIVSSGCYYDSHRCTHVWWAVARKLNEE